MQNFHYYYYYYFVSIYNKTLPNTMHIGDSKTHFVLDFCDS